MFSSRSLVVESVSVSLFLNFANRTNPRTAAIRKTTMITGIITAASGFPSDLLLPPRILLVTELVVLLVESVLVEKVLVLEFICELIGIEEVDDKDLLMLSGVETAILRRRTVLVFSLSPLCVVPHNTQVSDELFVTVDDVVVDVLMVVNVDAVVSDVVVVSLNI